jgi:hypothetical protein
MIRDFSDQVMLIADQPGPVRCGKRMRVLPDRTLEDAPPLDAQPQGHGHDIVYGHTWAGDIHAAGVTGASDRQGRDEHRRRVPGSASTRQAG